MTHKQKTKSERDPVVISIIGCGASGVVTLNYLVDYYSRLKLSRPVSIHIFEKSKTLGVGVAYGTDNDEHILNMRNGTVDIFQEKPNHFMDWLGANAQRLGLSEQDIDFDSFLPRRVVGIYLKESLEASLLHARLSGIEVNFIHEEVADCREVQDGQRLYFGDSCLDTDYTIFCVGNLPSTNYPELYDAPGYLHSPWELNSAIRNSSKSIGILGASLTAVDTAIELAPTTRGPLYFIAPTGRLPKVLHIRRSFEPQFVTKENIRLMTKNFTRKLSLGVVIELFKREIETAVAKPINWGQIQQINDDPKKALEADIARAENGENHWHTVLADTSPLLPLIWGNLREHDKKIFQNQYYPWWRIYRVSMPLQNAKKIYRLLENGRLIVVRNLQSIQYDKTSETFRITSKNDDALNVLEVPYLVDATGTGFNVFKSKSKLIRNMLASGLFAAHPMGGIDVNFKTLRLIRKSRKEARRMFFFGMLTKGVHFYTNALDANAVHGEQIAKIIMNDILKEY